MTGGPGLLGGADYGDATPFSVTIFHSGGTGARPWRDGLSATAFPSGVRNTPVEITESIAPVIFHQKELREGSGGDGQYRGGHGQVIEVSHAEGAPFAIYALFDRVDHPARGRHGGADGVAGTVRLASGKKTKNQRQTDHSSRRAPADGTARRWWVWRPGRARPGASTKRSG